jgi:ribosomal protein S18 acetylase RimI-like enzyme
MRYAEQRESAQQKPADGGAADQAIAPREHADSPGSLAASLNRAPGAQALLQLRDALDERPAVQSQLALQRALDRRNRPGREPAAPSNPNATGLPDRLKAGVQHLSGLAMDDVRVHYNSQKPAAVQAHAYAQRSDIHVAPGQEKHLPHEAWHVVQQKQGRVKPTLQLKGVAINDDSGLEREADRMGAQARHAGPPKAASGRPAESAQVSDAARLGDGSHQVTAAQDGRPAGSVKLHDRGSGTIEVTDLGVPAAQRGSGVGHRLLASAVRAGRRLGGRKVSLDADDKGSGRLISWYQQMGFSRTGVNARGKPRLEAPIGKVEGAVAQKRAEHTARAPVAQRAQAAPKKGENAEVDEAAKKLASKGIFTLRDIRAKKGVPGSDYLLVQWNLVHPDEKLDDQFELIKADEKKPDTLADKQKAEWIDEYVALIPHLAGEKDGTGGHLLSLMKKTHGKQLVYKPNPPPGGGIWTCIWRLRKPGSIDKAENTLIESDFATAEKSSSMFPSDWTVETLKKELQGATRLINNPIITLNTGIEIQRKDKTFFPK